MKIHPVTQVKQNFKSIVNNFEKTAETYDTEFIPPNTLSMVLDSYRIKILGKTKNEVEYYTNYNALLKSLEETCLKIAKMHPSGKIPISHIRLFIKQITTNL